MKAGLASSVVMHAALIGFGLFSLSAPAPMQVADVESLPVDIVPVEELTQIQQGEKTAPMTDRAAPEPTQRPDPVQDAVNIGENSVDTDTAPTPEPAPRPVQSAAVPEPQPEPVEKPDPVAEGQPPAEPEPAPTTEVAPVPLPRQEVVPEPERESPPEPTPEPEPVKAEQPTPEPVKPSEPEPAPEEVETASVAPEELKPDAIGETIVEEAEAQPAEPTETVSLPQSAPRPASRPQPPAQTAQTPERRSAEEPARAASSRPQSDEKEFDADAIAALLDKQKPSGGGAKRSNQQASLGGERTTGGTKLSQSEMDALRGQVQRCWNIPAGAVDGDKLRVSVKFRLDRSGALEGSPEIISGGGSSGVERAAAEAARRAVARCAPYNLPAEKYETWAEVIVNFDPSEMY
jgi:colicin import membrane protein